MTNEERLARMPEKQFHFFPQDWPRLQDFEMADMLCDAGFSEVSAGGPNYGPVHHSGQIFEHYINFRRVLVEEETFCAGLEVKWWEFPLGGLHWHFALYSGHFEPGHQLPERLDAPYDQGRAPHFWISKLDSAFPDGKPESRILGGDLKHLTCHWIQHLESFDREFINRLLVAIDGFLETRQMVPFIAKTSYAPGRDFTWRRPPGWPDGKEERP